MDKLDTRFFPALFMKKPFLTIVITPPCGYMKNRNTNIIHLHPEAAETAWLIYDYYLQNIRQIQITHGLHSLGAGK